MDLLNLINIYKGQDGKIYKLIVEFTKESYNQQNPVRHFLTIGMHLECMSVFSMGIGI